MHVEMIDSPERLAEIERAWLGLLVRSGSHEIFATPAWTLAWFVGLGLGALWAALRHR